MGIVLLPSMVVEQIDFERIAILEAEDDAPGASHGWPA
jgi:hypothetical protein